MLRVLKVKRRLLRFSDVRFDNAVASELTGVPGIYEIWTSDGVLLKVGIAKNLRERLKRHGESLQNGLRPTTSKTDWDEPCEVRSSRSILAKHLYFDRTIAPAEFDLREESDRQRFLEEHCRIVVKTTNTKPEAREFERDRERSARYYRIVVKR